jgi:hypothetical protein
MVRYVDSITNISWVPDAPEYITTGVNGYVQSAPSIYPNFSEFTTVRYFPDTRAKNSYSFPVMPNSTYLIRGTFFYLIYKSKRGVCLSLWTKIGQCLEDSSTHCPFPVCGDKQGRVARAAAAGGQARCHFY